MQGRVFVKEVGNKSQVQLGVPSDNICGRDKLAAAQPLRLLQHAFCPPDVVLLLRWERTTISRLGQSSGRKAGTGNVEQRWASYRNPQCLTSGRPPIAADHSFCLPGPKSEGGFAGGSGSKQSACNVGDPGFIPGSGRSPGEGTGYTLQYPPVDRGACGATVHGVTKIQT